jgi:PhzF family phenazine biosynthesis protein
MILTLYQIDAFTDVLFKGNPAAVCPLEDWLPDSLLQAIAEENNLSETAFYVPTDWGFHIRWFTPVAEVDLCGHATLAAAFVIFECTSYPENMIRFASRSGELRAERDGDLLIMDFPSQPVRPCHTPQALIDGLGKKPLEVLHADDYLALFENEDAIISLRPNYEVLKKLDLRGIIVTALGNEVDFVSRFFAPKYGINEDPVTGSAHCELVPFWHCRLDKSEFRARQLSKRGGEITCSLEGNRVFLAGKAVKYMEGTVRVQNP